MSEDDPYRAVTNLLDEFLTANVHFSPFPELANGKKPARFPALVDERQCVFGEHLRVELPKGIGRIDHRTKRSAGIKMEMSQHRAIRSYYEPVRGVDDLLDELPRIGHIFWDIPVRVQATLLSSSLF
jgi:hypothetical protein